MGSNTGIGGLIPGNIPRNFNKVAGYVFDLQAQEQTFCDSLPADTRDDFTRSCIGYKLSILDTIPIPVGIAVYQFLWFNY